MDKYKHYEDKYVRMTICHEKDKEKIENVKKQADERGIKIKVGNDEFVFLPSLVLKSDKGEPVLYLKFSHDEKLVIYHLTGHPESRKAFEALTESIRISNLIFDEEYLVRNIMDYLHEIQKMLSKLEEGKIKLKDGIHPKMKSKF